MNRIKAAVIILFLASLITAGCNDRPPGPKIGALAPDFALKDAEGKTWRLSDLKGQVVFINFWATWCPPCLQELPSMQKLYAAMPADQFKMLAVLNNDKMGPALFLAGQKGYTMPILDDSDNMTGSLYRLTGLPETYIVDKDGILRHKFIGPEQWDAAEYMDMIKTYINREAGSGPQ